MGMRAFGFKLVLCMAGVSLLALPALAEGPPDDELAFAGILGFEAGPRFVESTDDPDNNTHGTFAGEGHVSLPLASSLSLQMDVQSEMHTDDGEDSSTGAHMVGGHLSLRNPDCGLVGVFGGGGLPSSESLGNPKIGWLVGGEVQGYLGDFTLYTHAGFGDFRVDDDKEGFTNGWFIGGSGRYFPTDDSMIEAGAAYGATDKFIDGGDKGAFWNWSAKGKIRILEKYPVYATASYLGGDYDSDEEGDEGSEHRVMFGLTFLLGADSLKHNDRYGATLELPMLPTRAASWTEGLD